MEYEDPMEFQNSSGYQDPDELSPLQYYKQNFFVNSFLVFLFTATVLTTTIGNVMIIWTIITNQVMRTCTNYLIAGMAITDTLYAIIHTIRVVPVATTGSLLFGSAFCYFGQFTIPFTVVASSFTLLAISVVQYRNILRWNQKQFGLGVAIKILFAIWISTAAIASPNAIWAKFLTFYGKTYCYTSIDHILYDVLLTISRFFGPAIGLIVTYALIMKYIRMNIVPRNKRQLVNMNMFAAAAYITGWIGEVFYFLIYTFAHHSFWSEAIYLIMNWLTLCGCLLKPLIYFGMNSEFQHQIKKTFPWVYE